MEVYKRLMELDQWQKDVMETKGNMVLRSGRQVGKSTIIGLKAAHFALDNPKKLIMVISKTERQAGLLFAKILNNIHNIARNEIMKGKYRPTKHKITLKNGSVIHSLPAGDTGFGLMGFTINLLIADEAAFINEEVWNSVIPALAVARGEIWLLSTPFLREGYYYSCFSNPSFTSFHTTSEDCPRRDDKFLAEQKRTRTDSQYAQMYLGEFIDEFNRFFPDDLIEKVFTLPKPKEYTFASGSISGRDLFLGVDVGRVTDPSTFEGFDGTNPENIIQIFSYEKHRPSIPETARECIRLNEEWDLNKIGIDNGGMGAGVLDMLLEESSTQNKVVGLDNATKAITVDDDTINLLKADMYVNLRMLMERGYIKMFNDPELIDSFKSVQIDYKDKRMKIGGNNTHRAEGAIRGVQLIKDKDLKCFIRSL